MSCKDKIFTLRRGQASNANGRKLVYRIPGKCDVSGWKAIFQIQDTSLIYDDIASQIIEIIIPAEETLKMKVGFCFGWMKLIDDNQASATLHCQKFLVLNEDKKFE